MAQLPEAVLDRLRALAAGIAGGHGLDVFDLQFRREARGWVLRVVLDRPPAAGGTGEVEEAFVGIEDCRLVSVDLGAALDVDDALDEAIDRAYTLEVSSPGLDRPLRGEADYRRFAGRLAKVVTREPVGGQTSFAGRLQGVEDGDVLLAEGRRLHRVPLGAISRARLDVEF